MSDDLRVAVRAALTGAAVGLRYFAALADLPREHKADGSVVTEADRTVEAAIRAVLSDARPDDAVRGEEGGGVAQRGGRRWIVDPIDGTAMFVAGDDRWLVLVALEEDGEVIAGVAAVPAQHRIWWATRGSGAFEASIPADTVVSEPADADPARVGPTAVDGAVDLVLAEARRISVTADGPALPGAHLGVIPDDNQIFPAERVMLAPLLAATPARPWWAHAALLVARGDLDVAVQTRGEVWDFAATTLIVEEAGGQVSGLDGHARPSPGTRVYAATESLRAATVATLRGTAD
jgi:histidinol-phosphatase